MTLDDATAKTYSAFLAAEEGTASTFRAFNEVFGAHGLPMSLYTDRGSNYFSPPKPARSTGTSSPRSGGRWSNWGGAYRRLSSGARPSERAFQTLRTGWSRNSRSPGSPPSRRPTPSSGTSICRSTTPASPSSRPAGLGLHAHSGRRSRRDPVRAGGAPGRQRQLRLLPTLKLQIPESPMRPHFVKARVKVRHYLDGSHALFHGPRCIGRYDEKGALKDSQRKTRRLTPLGGARLWTAWTSLRLAHPAHRRTKPEEADISWATKTGQLNSLSPAISIGGLCRFSLMTTRPRAPGKSCKNATFRLASAGGRGYRSATQGWHWRRYRFMRQAASGRQR